MWICNFNEEEDSADDANLLAEYVGNSLEANVPYFVAPYDGTNGTDMRGKTYVFSATDVTVKPNPSAITSGTYHMIVGEFARKMIDDAYFLNPEGSHFEQAAGGVVKAFEVYADNVIASSAVRLEIVLDENAEEAPTSLRGDVDGDGSVMITDVACLIDYILSGNAEGVDLVAADCDLSGTIDIGDISALIDYLLKRSW